VAWHWIFILEERLSMKALGSFATIRALLSVVLVLSAVMAAWAQPAATTTTLSVTPNSVAPDTAVTLTATVTSTTAGTITGLVSRWHLYARCQSGGGLCGGDCGGRFQRRWNSGPGGEQQRLRLCGDDSAGER